MRQVRALPWVVAAVVVGLTAEWALYRFGHTERWVPDLLTGWVLVGCGLLAWCGRPNRRVGPLLTATGMLWFVGNFATVPVEALAWAAAHGVYLHRGPLVHAIVTYPTGRARSRLERAAVLVGYAAATVEAAWADERSAIVLGLALIVVTAVLHARSVPRERRARLLALWVAAAVGSVIAGGAAARLILSPSDVAEDISLLAYEVVLCAAAAALTVGVLSRSLARAEVADLVVELGEQRSDRLRHVLARELGDPTLQVGYWSADLNGYIDSSGRPLLLPTAGGPASTTIGTSSDPIAILIHHPSLVDDPGLLDSIATAARLASVNARLQAEVRAQITELEASRRRIVTAGDEEHRRLEQRLRNGAERRLEELADRLRPAGDRTGDDAPSEPMAEVVVHLAETLNDLRMLAAGLRPRMLTECGLTDALDTLAARSRTDIRVTVDGGENLPSTVEGEVYFVCSEALANIDKHAAAAWASVAVTVVDDRLVRIDVCDDGTGGADPTAGSGLVNLVDRVNALGGTFDLTSPQNCGTRIVVELPVDALTG